MNNSITVVGHVGQAPQERKFSSGAKLAKFSVAVKEFSPNGDDKTLLARCSGLEWLHNSRESGR